MVNGYVFRFRVNATAIDSLIKKNGYSASLLRWSPDGSGMFSFTSVLNIDVTDSSDLIEISCHNGRTTTRESVQYYPTISSKVLYVHRCSITTNGNDGYHVVAGH